MRQDNAYKQQLGQRPVSGAAIKTFIDPVRGRPGYATSNVVGPMTDYAINTNVDRGSFGGCCGTAPNTIQGQIRGNARTVQGISDGSSNTILVWTKYIQTTQYNRTSGNGWDESVLQGRWGGAGRAGATSAPDGSGVPGYLRDNAAFAARDNRGGGSSGGGLFLFGDGSVRTVPYAVNRMQFRNMLNPADGQAVRFD